MSGNKCISFDSCIFTAWFNAEEDKDLNAIQSCLTMVSNKEAKLFVSIICVSEVLNILGKSTARDKLALFLKRENVVAINTDYRIAERGAIMRESVKEAFDKKLVDKSIKAPDALIAASCIIYKVETLLTYDPVLLKLSSMGYLDSLRCCKPEDFIKQKSLFL